jgi:putative transposase
MITPTHKLPISRQTKLLGLARSTAYYQPKPVADSDLALMAAMDRLLLAPTPKRGYLPTSV